MSDETGVRYRAVHNDEQQYSVWQTGRDLPAGWYETGFEGDRQQCLDHIERTWTDMRPASVRAALDDRDDRDAGDPPA